MAEAVNVAWRSSIVVLAVKEFHWDEEQNS
jgi:hypothetical protein